MDAPGRVDRPLGGPGWELVDRAAATIARCGMLTGGETVVVAVSGGPDSTCLLDVLARLSNSLDLDLVVAHVDHRLSELSEEIAARVAKQAASDGYDVHVGRAPDLHGPNLQARARDFRYAFLEAIAEQEGATRIATGHTLDDRVETTLARLIHGAGTDGLAGIPPVDGNRMRPLIDIRRSETRAYCIECDLEFTDDPANEDPRFDRPVVRSRIVTAIEEHWGAGAVNAIASSAGKLAEDSAALRALSDDLFTKLAKETEEGTRFERDLVTAMPRALRRRLLERAIGRVRDRSGGIEGALDALDRGKTEEARFSVASGFEIVIYPDRVVVTRMAT